MLCSQQKFFVTDTETVPDTGFNKLPISKSGIGNGLGIGHDFVVMRD